MQTLTNGQKQALLESQNGHNIFISGAGLCPKKWIFRNGHCHGMQGAGVPYSNFEIG